MATMEAVGPQGRQPSRSGSESNKVVRNATFAFSIRRGDGWQLRKTEAHKPLQADRTLTVTWKTGDEGVERKTVETWNGGLDLEASRLQCRTKMFFTSDNLADWRIRITLQATKEQAAEAGETKVVDFPGLSKNHIRT